MMYFLPSIVRCSFLNGKFLPFKIYHLPTSIEIKNGAKIELSSRLTLGNPNKNKPIISRLPINLFFGKNSKTKIGNSVSIGAGVNIIVKDNAQFSIGDNTYFTSDMHIEVVNEVSIGSDCAISWGVTIIDDNHHQLMIDSNIKEEKNSHVLIGNKVWIGCNVTILKNSQIGNNCVVAAGSVVKGKFPDNCLIAGNPAIIAKHNVDWK